MQTVISWFIRNPVAANLLMVCILVIGALSLWGMRIEGFPKLPADSIEINVSYPGASAEQIDQSVTRRLEQSITGLQGVKKVLSLSLDGISTLTIQKQNDYSLDRLMENVKRRIDNINFLPEDALRPEITQEDFTFPALIVQIYGDLDQDTLQRSAQLVKQALLARAEISSLRQWGERERELSIEISPQTLETYKLTLQDIAERIREYSLLYKTGTLKTEGGFIQLRADKRAVKINDFAEIPIVQKGDGTRIKLGDIAKITNGFEEDEVRVRFQGKPAIGFEILLDQKGNLLDTSRTTRDVIKDLRKTLPDSVKLDIWADQSSYISDRLALLQRNGWQGLMLVFILLALFLDLRLAFWVSLGIPISIAGTLGVMESTLFEYSLNDITTFGIIVVLGILVDDAIIVGESIFTERKAGINAIRETEKGVEKVAVATVFGVLTTIAAIYPMTTIDNPLGKLLSSFSVVIMLALLFSLVESKLILPAHLAASRIGHVRPTNALSQAWRFLQDRANSLLNNFNKKLYQPLLTRCLVYRYAVVLLFIAITTGIIGLATVGVVRTTFFPDIPSSIISVTMEMDARAPQRLTLENTEKLKQAANTINTRFMAQPGVHKPPIDKILVAIVGAYSAEFYADLGPGKNRAVDTLSVLKAWREEVGLLEGVVKLNFSATENTGGGFSLTLYAEDEAILRQATDDISYALRQLEGVNDVRDDLQAGEQQIRLLLKPTAHALGLTMESLAVQIGDTYGGLEVQRYLSGLNEVRVMTRFKPQSRDSLQDLMQARIILNNGDWVPLHHVAEMQSRYTLNAIWRKNNQRAITLAANIDKTITSPRFIYETLEKTVIARLESQYPELKVQPDGELKEEAELKRGLIKSLLIGLLLIYTLLAIPLKSYWQPLIIMSIIPFAFAGAVLGHWITGIPFSLLSFFGMLALAGVVVNDSLVMIVRYNQIREKGLPMNTALVEAGSSRLRAVFLTTVTTTVGLMPLLSETSEQAQYLIPAVVSLVYGELFATVITLILVPVLTRIGHDIEFSICGQPAIELSANNPPAIK